MQINKTENSLKGLTAPQREWFQTMKQRKEEKERLSVNPNETTEKGKDKTANNKAKKRGGGDHEFNKKNTKKRREERMSPEQLAKARAMREIEKVSLVRAKLMKSKSRPGKLNAHDEDDEKPKSKMTNKRRSKFNLDLTDTSNRGSKKLRYVWRDSTIVNCFAFLLLNPSLFTGMKRPNTRTWQKFRPKRRPVWWKWPTKLEQINSTKAKISVVHEKVVQRVKRRNKIWEQLFEK